MYSGRSFNVGLGLLEDALALREGAFDLSDFDFVIAARLFKLRFDRRRAARFFISKFEVERSTAGGGQRAAARARTLGFGIDDFELQRRWNEK